MFWSRRKPISEEPVTQQQEAAQGSVAEINQVEPEKIEAPGTTEEVQSYVALCRKIGAETPAVRMLQLEQFMAERGIPEYDTDAVDDRLLALAKKSGGTNASYVWHPLREQDKGVSFRWFWEENGRELCTIEDTVYHELVPASVLETVSIILEQFPDAKFFVSDLPDEDDPFLLVTFPDVSPLIVDFWNEPDFRPE
jgi:hypothetical protein